MRMPVLSITGLGDIPDCGTDPCTWWDSIYMRDACLQYKTCVNPNDPAVILVTQGLIVGGAQVVGQTAGSAVGGGIQAAINGLVGGGNGTPINWGTIALVGIAGVIGIMLLRPLLTGRR